MVRAYETIIMLTYDLNGAKGPNTFGKDIGYMLIAPYEKTENYDVVAPMPAYYADRIHSLEEAYEIASETGYRIPTKTEARAVANIFCLAGNEPCEPFTSTMDQMIYAGASADDVLFYFDWLDETFGSLVLVTQDGSAPKNFKEVLKTAESFWE